jgi:hypothetical protein
LVRDDRGQLYTMEGIAAALIMLATIYLVINATSVYTAGDTHISDMQLEALGSDALMMMDQAPDSSMESPLQEIIEVTPLNTENTTFREMFSNYVNASGSGPTHNIQFNATYTCRRESGNPPTMSYVLSSTRNLTGGEHTVRATRWVIVHKQVCDSSVATNRSVLVEALLWRD